MADVHDRILDQTRSRLPGAGEDFIYIEWFAVVDELCREALHIDPPTDSTKDLNAVPARNPPISWLPVELYYAHYNLIIDGILARMYAQKDKPWTNPELATAHFGRFSQAMRIARVDATEIQPPSGSNPPAADTVKTVNRIYQTIRGLIPSSRDAEIDAALYASIQILYRDVLQLVGPTADKVKHEWLSDANYLKYYSLLLDGTLGRLYSLSEKPWGAPPLAELYLKLFSDGIQKAQIDATGDIPVGHTNHERLYDVVRATIPNVRDPEIDQALFTVVQGFYRDVLYEIPPAGNTAKGAWLDAIQYRDNFQLLLDGTLARLYAQPNKSWTSEALATHHFTQWERSTRIAQIDGTTKTKTQDLPERIIDNVKSKIPDARNGSIQMELFNIVDELAREALYITPPDSDADMDNWLPDSVWETHYRIIMDGTLARMYLHNAPYGNPKLAEVHAGLWATGLSTARVDHATTNAQTLITGSLLDTLRINLPGAKDGAIQLELGNTIDELCRHAQIYRSTIAVVLSVGDITYSLAPPEKTIDRVLSITHETLDVTEAFYDPDADLLVLPHPPGDVDVLEPLYVVVALVPLIESTVWTSWLTVRLWQELHTTLVDGVMHRMCAQPGKPYTNAQLAQFHGRRFRSKMGIQRQQAVTLGAPEAQPWMFPRFA